MKRLIKENKGEFLIFITLIGFLLVNSIIDKITVVQVSGFLLILIAGLLRILVFNKLCKQNQKTVNDYIHIEKS
ncbi:MAG: hypothetical protein ACLROI_05985 [Beduini sp.]|uniref:hypothetical protein n=1 Tax=Beduini sp. TaxID=1922300 RepID=UPI0011CB41E8